MKYTEYIRKIKSPKDVLAVYELWREQVENYEFCGNCGKKDCTSCQEHLSVSEQTARKLFPPGTWVIFGIGWKGPAIGIIEACPEDPNSLVIRQPSGRGIRMEYGDCGLTYQMREGAIVPYPIKNNIEWHDQFDALLSIDLFFDGRTDTKQFRDHFQDVAYI